MQERGLRQKTRTKNLISETYFLFYIFHILPREYLGAQSDTWLAKYSMEAESLMIMISVFLTALQG